MNRGNVIDLGIGMFSFLALLPRKTHLIVLNQKKTSLTNLNLLPSPGVVIGGAFSDIIDSFVSDILTPPLSLWAYGTNLENSFFILRPGRTPGKKYATYLEAQADGAV